VIRARRSKSAFDSAFGNSGANFKKILDSVALKPANACTLITLIELALFVLIEDPSVVRNRIGETFQLTGCAVNPIHVASSFFDRGVAMKISLFASAVFALGLSLNAQVSNAAVIDWATWNAPTSTSMATDGPGGAIAGSAGSTLLNYTAELISLSLQPVL